MQQHLLVLLLAMCVLTRDIRAAHLYVRAGDLSRQEASPKRVRVPVSCSEKNRGATCCASVV
ncbi:hypothetical protein [Pontibacter rugosus]